MHQKLEINGEVLHASFVSMGNPHAVIFVDDLDAAPFERLGPAIEVHARFPARTNVEFVEVLNRNEVRMRVWERGVGETLACGTGACAVGFAAAYLERTATELDVHLPGGTLRIDWPADHRVYMTGPAEEVFSGTLAAPIAALLKG